MNTPIVSIIIPTFNAAKSIGDTLESIITQTYTYWECLVVDDGSADATVTLVAKYCKQDPRIKFFERPPHGANGGNVCRNIGIDKSQGSFLIFLDADDLLVETALERRISMFQQNPNVDALVYSTQVVTYDLQKRHILNKDPKDVANMKAYLSMFLSYEIPWQISGPIWKKSVLTEHGGFDEDFQRFQDVEFHTRLLFHGIQILRVFEPDFWYRQAPKDTSKYRDQAFINKALTAIYQYVHKFCALKNNGILNQKEKQRCLRALMKRVFSKYIIQNKENHRVRQFMQVSRLNHLFTSKELFQFKVLFYMEKHNLRKIKGLGMHRLYRNFSNNLEL